MTQRSKHRKSGARKPLDLARSTLALPPAPHLTRLGGHQNEYLPELALNSFDPDDQRQHCVLGVTTFNRREYIEAFVKSFDRTRNRAFRWTLIIADDGSTDSTLNYLETLKLEDCQVVIVKNKRASVTGQTNTIFKVAQSLSFDFGFKADDDIYFYREGWDTLYLDASRTSGFDHLIFHDPSWMPSQHIIDRGHLRSHMRATDTLGCFWTFTPRHLRAVGYFDEPNFRLRGHSHWDFTLRSCRLGFNEIETAWDVRDSDLFIRMWPRKGYLKTVDWKSDEVRSVLSQDERARRQTILDDPGRKRLSQSESSLGPRPARVLLTPHTDLVATRLQHSAFVVNHPGERSQIDRIHILYREADEFNRLTATSAFENALPGQLVFDRSSPHPDRTKPLRAALEAARRDRLTSIAIVGDPAVAPFLTRRAFAKGINELTHAWQVLAVTTPMLQSGRESVSSPTNENHVNSAIGALVARHPVFDDLIELVDAGANSIGELGRILDGQDSRHTFTMTVGDPSADEVERARDAMTRPAISVIVPISDAQSSHWWSLASLSRQSVTNFEMILVPMADMDHVVTHAHELATWDPRVRVQIVKSDELRNVRLSAKMAHSERVHILSLDEEYSADHLFKLLTCDSTTSACD